jgi:catechol 2,3-dioxygenase-like lactoylglutathione lyase family enzyme
MPVDLQHVIVPATDPRGSARFLADILDLPVWPAAGACFPVRTANAVTLDFVHGTRFTEQHYAFLVDDETFDAGLRRLREHRACIWADAARHRPDQINHLHGGRRLYFDDPDGHLIELITTTRETRFS